MRYATAARHSSSSKGKSTHPTSSARLIWRGKTRATYGECDDDKVLAHIKRIPYARLLHPSSSQLLSRSPSPSPSTPRTLHDMARTGACHHFATFLLFAACILLLITTISAPVVNTIALMKVDLRNSSTISFGTFGYCVLKCAIRIVLRRHSETDRFVFTAQDPMMSAQAATLATHQRTSCPPLTALASTPLLQTAPTLSQT